MKIISLLDLKAYLGVDDTQNDNMRTMLIKSISTQIQTHLNRILTKTTYTEYYECGQKFYYVEAMPIDLDETLTVTIDGIEQIAAKDYYVYNDIIEFVSKTQINYKGNRVKITYTGGYQETNGVLEIPDDMKLACLMQCSYLIQNRDTLGFQQIDMGVHNRTVKSETDNGFLPLVNSLLKPYRRIPIGFQ